MHRDLTLAGLVALVLIATVPAYERVFAEPGWRAPALLGAVLALLLAVLVRRLRGNALVGAVVSLVSLLGALPWLLGLTGRPVVPGPEVISLLREMLDLAWVELAETPAPAPASQGLVLLTAAGWWGVALVAHELAVRWRRTGAAVVVLLVLWATPLAIPVTGSERWTQLVPFLVAAGLLVLAGGDQASDTPGRAPRLPSAGLAVGGVAIVVAVVAPGLIPGHQEDAWLSLGEGSSPRGYQPIVDVTNRLGLPEEREVLRVRSPQRTYLRLAGLDGFDGSTWRLGTADEGNFRPDPGSLHAATDLLPPEEPASNARSFDVDVEVLELENIYVPLPYQPVEVLGPLRSEMVWSTEGGFLATWDTVESSDSPTIGIRQGVEYRVRTARPDPTFDELTSVEFDDATVAANTELPREYPELAEQAEAVYTEAGAGSVVEQALALQDWFVGPDGDFTYDLDVPALRGDDALTDFVLEDRTGYCEYFATAMAVMLRATGIPARVAVGFLPGEVTREADPLAGETLDEYTVTTSDAHAWVEVLFPGYGWITFEPTPRSDDTHIVPDEQDLAPTENEAERRAREREEQGDELDLDPLDPDAQVPDVDQETDPGDLAGLGDGSDAEQDSAGTGSSRTELWLALAVLTIALAATVVLAGWWQRRIDVRASGRDRVLAAQRRLLRTAARAGIGRRPSETTVEALARWRREDRIDDRHARVGGLVQAAAFGGEVEEGVAPEAERTIAEAERSLRRSVPPRDRLLTPGRRAAGTLRRAGRRAAGWRDRTR